MTLINIGIVGTGGIAENALVPALQRVQGAQLWSVLSRELSRAQTFANDHKAQAPNPAYSDLPKMLEDPKLHAVIIATPDKLHSPQALLALQAGKHVLVEKPMCTDINEADEMIACAKERKLKLAIAYHLRWHAGHRALRQKVLDGYVGRITHVRAHWSWKALNGDNWRASDTVGKWWSLAGVGTHCLDLIRWFMLPSCGEVASVNSTISSGHWGSPHDETALVQMKFDSGATAEFCSSVLFDAPSRFEIYGENGFIICEETLGRHGAGKINTHEGEFTFAVQDPFQGEIQNFIQAITLDSEPEVNGIEGKRNIEIISLAAQLSGF
jgi:UDP-N-acetyl-2-amino-2-deoxyglucuronate dehydrogenase